VLLRLIDKWLSAGVLEDGVRIYPEAGSPQGGVISPLLSNIFLHYVLDEWFETVVKSYLGNQGFLVRYADDFIMAFAIESDARRVLEVLPKRFSKFGLTIHPEKTRLVRFVRPPSWAPKHDRSEYVPGTFDFLGFTHYWGFSRKGYRIIKRQTAASRVRRALKGVSDWCRRHRHRPIPEQHLILSQKLRGHYAYYGLTGNARALSSFYFAAKGLWRKWLSRRSWVSPLSWEQYQGLRERHPLPRPTLPHSVANAQPTR
jgi:hypothetical protein